MRFPSMTSVALALLCLGLAACARLPSGAPIREEILAEAEDPGVDYAVYPVTESPSTKVANEFPTSPADSE